MTGPVRYESLSPELQAYREKIEQELTKQQKTLADPKKHEITAQLIKEKAKHNTTDRKAINAKVLTEPQSKKVESTYAAILSNSAAPAA